VFNHEAHEEKNHEDHEEKEGKHEEKKRGLVSTFNNSNMAF